MPRRSPFVIELSPAERRELEARSRRYTSPYREVVRAKIVLMAAAGLENKAIASRLDLPFQIVSPNGANASSKQRFAGPGGARLGPDGPRLFPPELVIAVKAIACELPANSACPSPASRFPTSRPRSSTADSWPASPDPPSGNGCRGRHPALAPSALDLPPRPRLRAPRPAGCSTSTRASSKAERLGSRRVRDQLRREDLHPSPPALPSNRLRRAAPAPACGARVHRAAAPGPTWPPGMSTGPSCSGGWNRRPVSSRSDAWSIKSWP